MIACLSAFGAGLLFGLGLWLSGMSNPRKVLDFLDIAGNWDPSLLVVMAGAVALTAAFFRPLVLKRPAPLLGARFVVPTRRDIDAPLVLGAAVFGAGWGIAGYCPGPAVTALSNLTPEVFAFVTAMLAGGWLQRALERRALPAAAGST